MKWGSDMGDVVDFIKEYRRSIGNIVGSYVPRPGCDSGPGAKSHWAFDVIPPSGGMATKVQIKLVVVGDHVGKTNLLIVFSENRFAGYSPACPFQNFVADIDCEGKTVELALWDTAAQEDYDRLRPRSYPDSDVALICYSVVDIDSLDNVVEKVSPYQQQTPRAMAEIETTALH